MTRAVSISTALCLAAAAIVGPHAAPARADSKPLVLAVPGIPPIFASTVALVAKEGM